MFSAASALALTLTANVICITTSIYRSAYRRNISKSINTALIINTHFAINFMLHVEKNIVLIFLRLQLTPWLIVYFGAVMMETFDPIVATQVPQVWHFGRAVLVFVTRPKIFILR